MYELARDLDMPESSMYYNLQHLDDSLMFFRKLIGATAMSDDEILAMIRMKEIRWELKQK